MLDLIHHPVVWGGSKGERSPKTKKKESNILTSDMDRCSKNNHNHEFLHLILKLAMLFLSLGDATKRLPYLQKHFPPVTLSSSNVCGVRGDLAVEEGYKFQVDVTWGLNSETEWQSIIQTPRSHSNRCLAELMDSLGKGAASDWNSPFVYSQGQ